MRTGDRVRDRVRLEGGDILVERVERAEDSERGQVDEGLGAAEVVQGLEPVEAAEALLVLMSRQRGEAPL